MTAVRWARPPTLGDPSAPRMVVEASAGTGKTWFVTRRVVDLLLATDATIDRIVLVTYTEKATAELRLRLRDLLTRMAHGEPEPPAADAGADAVWVLDDERRGRLLAAIEAFDTAPISTIHGFCQRVLADESFAARRAFDQVQVPDDAALRGAFVAALRERFAREPDDRELLREYLEDGGTVERLFAAVLAVYRSGADLGPTGDAPGPKLVAAMVDEVVNRADRDKRRGGQLDFQDMLKLTADALTGSGGDDLARRLATRYPWALIDEFQDTDPLQWQIIDRVWGQPPARGLTVVGDPKQAIYSFRGGDVQTYLAATGELRRRGTAQVVLDVCQRATDDLIAAVNTLVSAPSPMFAGDIRYDRPVRGTGAVALRWDDGTPVKPLALLPVDGGLGADAAREQIHAAIADEIARLVLAPARRLEGTLRGKTATLRPGDLMVLTRRNVDSVAVAEAIRARGVPCALAQAEHLFGTVEARDVLALLDAIARPRDRSARLRAWMTDFFAVDPDHLSRAQELGDDHPLCARLHDWRAMAVRLDYPRLFASIMADSQVAERALASGGGERTVTNLAHVLEHLHAEVERSRCELPELVSRLRGWIREAEADRPDDSDVQRQETDRDAVQVMTMHRAKGLEAWVVFVACAQFTANSSRPTRIYHELRHDAARRLVQVKLGKSTKKGKSSDADDIAARAEADEKAEDRRLAYVALTRARGRLYLPVLMPKASKATKGKSPRPKAPTPGGGYAGVTAALFDNLQAAATTIGMERIDGWQPAAAQPAPLDVSTIELPAPPPPAPAAAPSSAGRIGFVVTSYSRIKAQAAAEVEVARDEVTGEDRSRQPPGPDELPGGAATGHLLHEVLEHVDARAALDEPVPLRWLARPEVEAVFAAAERHHGVASRHRVQAAGLVHRALTDEIVAGGLRLPRLGAARLAREVEFVYPIPDAAGAPPERRGRGFVKGFIDAVARWDGDDRWFVIDYKSDVIDLSEEAAAAHVDEHYRVQARLYSLALASMMKLRDARDHERRFGGLLYWFLRYQRIVHLTPSWSDLQAYRAELADGSFA
ncbi:MAG TPA: UvrD-helicase domain-containing protein [Kofleriaceae bacterium]|nr:UvrD-helicase domain-containing protein [Kofleriaceae bacterium]